MDPDGRIPLDTIVDVASAIDSSVQVVKSIREGDTKGAWFNAGMLLIDVASLALPYVTGVSSGLKAARAADNVVDAVKAADNVVDAGKAVGVVGSIKKTDLPENFRNTLDFIQDNGYAPQGYKGGGVFQNRIPSGKSETPLPVVGSDGSQITYKEWDVNPHIKGVNRNQERIVTGSDGSTYITTDHYETFLKLE